MGMINACVGNPGASKYCQSWPAAGWDHRSHRGTGIDPSAIGFWRRLQPGQKYRIPAPMASSIRQYVAEQFLNDVPYSLVKVHFIFIWEAGDTPCMHARYIDPISACMGEAEILLSGYSAVEFESIDDWGQPITITVKVCKDNRAVPEYLPLAFWH